MPRAKRVAEMDVLSAPDAAGGISERALDVTVDGGASSQGGEAPLAVGMSPARDLQAKLANMFSHSDASDECAILEQRYPLALSYGVTMLVCAGFWVCLGLALRAMIAA